jgi:hypothetical protein
MSIRNTMRYVADGQPLKDVVERSPAQSPLRPQCRMGSNQITLFALLVWGNRVLYIRSEGRVIRFLGLTQG